MSPIQNLPLGPDPTPRMRRSRFIVRRLRFQLSLPSFLSSLLPPLSALTFLKPTKVGCPSWRGVPPAAVFRDFPPARWHPTAPTRIRQSADGNYLLAQADPGVPFSLLVPTVHKEILRTLGVEKPRPPDSEGAGSPSTPTLSVIPLWSACQG